MYYTIGGFTLDDTVLPSGEIIWSAPGGNALYSAIGAHLWGVPVGIVTPIGHDYPQKYLEMLVEQGFDLSGVNRVQHPSFHVWILHETQNRRQILYRLDSGNNIDLDPKPDLLPPSIYSASGVHICPILGSSQAQLMEHLFRFDVPLFLDLIVIPDQIDVTQGHRKEFWPQLRSFMPSIEEVRAMFGDLPLSQLVACMQAAGPATFAIKMGDQGCLVRDGADGSLYHVPAYPANVVDTTGAGDAFCGGFMAGLQETGNAVEAALRGTVSSSFLIEDFGAIHALNIKPDAAFARLANLRDKVRHFSEVERRL